MSYELLKVLETIAQFPITDPENQDAVNMQKIAKAALPFKSNLKKNDIVQVILGSKERTAVITSIHGNMATLKVFALPNGEASGFIKAGIYLDSLKFLSGPVVE